MENNKRLKNSQLQNFYTEQMYIRQMLTMSENVFNFNNIPEFIEMSYVNKTLLRQGSIAFFEDEVLGLLALPYINLSKPDVYNRPLKIQVIGNNGYNKQLNYGEFVIMYDNEGRYPIYMDILQLAERIALVTRTIDININQQKVPRIWKTSSENVKTLEGLLNNIDGMNTEITTYDNIDKIIETNSVLAPAPFVADKLEDTKEKLWAEFLRLIGVANVTNQKKERLITDEVEFAMGGTIVSRYNRYNPRKKAIDLINKKFSHLLENPIELEYYDGLPTTLKEIENEGDVENDV